MKVEFNSSDLANQFKGKNIDIYGLYFGNKCVGLTEEKHHAYTEELRYMMEIN